VLRVFVGDAKENALGERDFAKMGVESEDARGDARSRLGEVESTQQTGKRWANWLLFQPREGDLRCWGHPVLGQEEREQEREEEVKEGDGSENINTNTINNDTVRFPFKDSDVICAKVREISRKPDEIYGVIERLLGPNSKKLELFARNWNVSSARKYQNWVCIGNQIQKTVIMDREISRKFDKEYPEFASTKS